LSIRSIARSRWFVQPKRPATLLARDHARPTFADTQCDDRHQRRADAAGRSARRCPTRARADLPARQPRGALSGSRADTGGSRAERHVVDPRAISREAPGRAWFMRETETLRSSTIRRSGSLRAGEVARSRIAPPTGSKARASRMRSARAAFRFRSVCRSFVICWRARARACARDHHAPHCPLDADDQHRRAGSHHRSATPTGACPTSADGDGRPHPRYMAPEVRAGEPASRPATCTASPRISTPP